MIRMALGIVLAVVLAGCGAAPVLSEYPVTYQVAGRAGAKSILMYTNAHGATETVTDPPLPWSQAVTLPRGSTLSLAVFSTGEALLTCVIEVNGVLLTKATTAAYGSTECSGSLP